MAQQVPQTTCVCIADSEADIYELFAEERGDAPVHWLIRAAQDRLLDAPQADEESLVDEELAAARQIHAAALATSVLFTKEISVHEHKLQIRVQEGLRQPAAREPEGKVEVRATTVTLRPPWRAEGQLPAVSVDVVLVCEIDLPVDDVPVEWLLLTTHPIDDMELVCRIVQYYSVRFII